MHLPVTNSRLLTSVLDELPSDYVDPRPKTLEDRIAWDNANTRFLHWTALVDRLLQQVASDKRRLRNLPVEQVLSGAVNVSNYAAANPAREMWLHDLQSMDTLLGQCADDVIYLADNVLGGPYWENLPHRPFLKETVGYRVLNQYIYRLVFTHMFAESARRLESFARESTSPLTCHIVEWRKVWSARETEATRTLKRVSRALGVS